MSPSGFEFTDVLLAREVVEDRAPSIASGTSLAHYQQYFDDDPDTAITWLLEPIRSSSATRYSGTMAHTNLFDKRHQTINTFVHFAYEYSLKTIIFADIESKLL